MKWTRWFGITAALLMTSMSGIARAQTPPTPVGFLWDAYFFQEPVSSGSPVFSHHLICFHNNGTWSSHGAALGNGAVGAEVWSGGWFQKGDRVRWSGFYPAQSLGTAAFGQLSAPLLMTGEYEEWITPWNGFGSYDRHFNYAMYRTNTPC